MKVKDLIKQLQEMDQEAEVVVGSEPIYFAEEQPGYYDGSYQVLIQDQVKSPFYNVEGMVFTRANKKVRLHTLSVSDMIWNCESLEQAKKLQWNFDKSLSDDQIERFKEEIKKTMKELEDYENN